MCEAQTPPEGPPEGRREPEIPKSVGLGEFLAEPARRGKATRVFSKILFFSSQDTVFLQTLLKIIEQSPIFDHFFFSPSVFENPHTILFKNSCPFLAPL